LAGKRNGGGFRVKRKERGEVQQYLVASRCRGRGREGGMELAIFYFIFPFIFSFFGWL
jgi:hypothetical protein